MVSFSTLTRVDRQILWELVHTTEWKTTSLFQLALDLGVDYSHAWASVTFLERIGLIDVQRGKGRGMVISLKPLCAPENPKKINPQRGTAIGAEWYSVHRTQGEDMEEELNLSALRSSLENQNQADYPRPEMTADEQERFSRVARRINSIQDQRMRLVYLAAVIGENVRLLREVNEHRQARGYQPLPEYDPEKR